MEIAVSIRATDGGNQQGGVTQIRGVYRNQFYLHRPLRKQALRGGGMLNNSGLIPPYRFGFTAGAYSQRGCPFRFFIHLNRLLVVLFGVPFLKSNRARGADRQAIAKTVAIVFPQQPRFPVNYAYGAFAAGLGAEAATVAFFLINSDYFSKHPSILLIKGLTPGGFHDKPRGLNPFAFSLKLDHTHDLAPFVKKTSPLKNLRKTKTFSRRRKFPSRFAASAVFAGSRNALKTKYIFH
jgi:hypothetical protein